MKKFTILTGKSATGKDYTLKELVKSYNLKPIISYTTRPKRNLEVQGVEYNFVTEDEFLNLIKNNSLAEYKSYNAIDKGKKVIWYYGTPSYNDTELYEQYVVVLSPNGAIDYVNLYGIENCNIFYFTCPDDIRKERYMSRDTKKNDDEWERRLNSDKIDFDLNSQFMNLDNFFIINNDGSKTIKEIADYIKSVD